MSRKAKAFCPAGITSFFEICDKTKEGKIISDEEKIGARGGGFVLERGVLTEVNTNESNQSSVEVYINGKSAPHAETTKTVVASLLERIDAPYEISVHHKVAVPIGAGFGSSGAGALGTALALSKSLGINLSMIQAGKIAHVAEVRCRTGLGTVGPISKGGCVITVEPGAPGYAVIDRIPTTSDHRIVTGYYKAILTKKILESEDIRKMVNKFGRETVHKILANPSLENFMNTSKEFARNTGFITLMTKELIELAEKAGANGATQNMVGEAVHALTTIDYAERVAEAFKKVLPPENVFIAKIDNQGARLLK